MGGATGTATLDRTHTPPVHSASIPAGDRGHSRTFAGTLESKDRTERKPSPRWTGPAESHPLQELQRAAGNQATLVAQQRALASASPPGARAGRSERSARVAVGAANDPSELEAETVAWQVVGILRAPPLGPAAGQRPSAVAGQPVAAHSARARTGELSTPTPRLQSTPPVEADRSSRPRCRSGSGSRWAVPTSEMCGFTKAAGPPASTEPWAPRPSPSGTTSSSATASPIHRPRRGNTCSPMS